MEIEFYGRHEKKQYYRAVFLAHKPPTRSAVLRIGAFVVVAAIYLFALISALLDEGQTSIDPRMLRHLITLLLFASFAFSPYIQAFTSSRNLWKDPIIRMPIRGTVSGDGITFGLGGNAHTTPWDDFIKVEKTEDLVVLLTIRKEMTILPRSFFQSDRDWKTFQQWIERYVKIPI